MHGFYLFLSIKHGVLQKRRNGQMKKLLLIMIASVICFFTTSVQSIANARILKPLLYKSNFSIDTEPTTKIEKGLMPIIYNFRYADTITVMSMNNYIKLFNIQFDPTANYDLREIFADLGGSSPYMGLTNQEFIRLPYIMLYQTKYKNQLNQKISQFTDSQKKQYLAIAYNMKMASLLYHSAIIEMNDFINENYSVISNSNNALKGFTAMAEFLKADELISNALYKNMVILAENNNFKMVKPSIGSNVPKDSNTLYDVDKSIEISLKVVKAHEADALLQNLNMQIAEDPNLSNVELSAGWDAKGNLYKIKENYTEALNCYNKAISLNPSKGTFWANRAFAKWSLADFSGAVSDYSKAIELGSETPENYYNRACSRVVLGQYNEAANDFKTVYQLAQDPKDAYLGTLSLAYSQSLFEGNSQIIKQKILLDNPLVMKKYMEKTGQIPINQTSSKSPPKADKEAIKQQPAKSVCPPGCRVYLIIGVLKGTITEVRFTTIADRTKIEDLVNADPRFEWVRYESVPDSYLDRYPRY